MVKYVIKPSYWLYISDKDVVLLRRDDGHVIKIIDKDAKNIVSTLYKVLEEGKIPKSKKLKVLFEKLRGKNVIIPKETLELHGRKALHLLRQVIFFSNFTNHGAASQEALKNVSVGIIGLDVLGANISYELSHSGIGSLFIYDPLPVTKDMIGHIYELDDVGKSRVDALEEKLSNLTEIKKSSSKNLQKTMQTISSHSSHIIISSVTPCFSFFEKVNRILVEGKTDYTFIWFEGIHLYIGPTVIPRETACFREFLYGKMLNVKVYSDYKKMLSEKPVKRGFFGALNPMISMAGGLISTMLINHFADVAPLPTLGKVFVFDFFNLQISSSSVWENPLCPICGRFKRTVPQKGENFELFRRTR